MDCLNLYRVIWQERGRLFGESEGEMTTSPCLIAQDYHVGGPEIRNRARMRFAVRWMFPGLLERWRRTNRSDTAAEPL